jgi:hypothetical protein
MISATINIEESTRLSYFFGAIGLPLREIRECAFHIDIGEMEKFRNGKWRVCSVTHALMQKEEVGHVNIAAEGKIHLRKELLWLFEGRGRVLKRLRNYMASGKDDALLLEFFRMNQAFRDLSEGSRSKEGLESMGLDSANMRFVNAFLMTQGRTVGDDHVGCCGC